MSEQRTIEQQLIRELPGEPGCWQGTWIVFDRTERIAGHKTDRWIVNSNGVALGLVRWFNQWRKYCFFPASDTVYEQVCLREIAAFCEQRTQEHRKAAA